MKPFIGHYFYQKGFGPAVSGGPLRSRMEFLESNELSRASAGSEASPPSGVCFSGDIVVVSDEFNHRLELYKPKDGTSTFVGKQGHGPGEFYYPKGIQADRSGNFYVADCWNHRVQKFSKTFEYLFSFGQYGDGPGKFNEPYSIAVGSDDLIYVVDRCNHRIQVFDSNGNFTGTVGQRGTAIEEDLAELYETPLNLFKKPAFEFPNDIAFDSGGNMFVVDSNNHRVVCLDRFGEFFYSFGSKGSGGTEFKFPYGICIDENDLLFISDMNNERIQVFTPQGVLVSSYKGGEGGNVLCPATIRINLSGDLCYATGFSPSLFCLSYRHSTLSDFYKEQVSLRKSELQAAVYLSTNGEDISGVDTFISFLLGATPQILINEVECRSKSFDFFLNLSGLPVHRLKKNFLVLNALLENSFEEQKKVVRVLFDKRAELGREIFENLLRREGEILKGEDTFNTRLITIEREDRDLYRELRREMLTLKRVTCLNAWLSRKVLEYKKQDAEVRADDNALMAVARHTLTLLCYTQEVLEEREEYHSSRERYFRDQSNNKEENLANFRFVTHLFENIESMTGVFVELLKSQLVEVNCTATFLSPKEVERFRRLLLEGAEGVSLRELVSKIYLFTQDNPTPYYASIQPVLKEFLRLFDQSIAESFNPENPFCVGENENVLAQVTHLIISEELLLDSAVDFSFQLAPEVLTIHEKSFKEVSEAIKNTFAESERISVEAALLDVRLNKSVIRDEKLRIGLGKQLSLHSFAERLNSRTLSSLFLMQRINLLAFWGSDGLDKRSEYITELLCKSFETFYHYPAEMSESEEGKVKDLLDLKVNAMKHLIKKNFLDIATIFRIRASKSELHGFLGISFKKNIPETGQLLDFKNPVGICREPGGSLLVADSGTNTVINMTDSGNFLGKWSGRDGFDGNFFHPFGLAADSNGDIFVSDWYKHRIQKFDVQGNFISSFGRQGSGRGDFNIPGRIAIDKDDGIYVCDQLNQRVQKFDNRGNYLFSIGKSGEDAEGGTFRRPGGILITASGQLLVGDYSGSRIQLFNRDGDYISDFHRMEGNGASCVVELSQSVDGTIFISDFWNGEITLLAASGEYIGKLGGEGRGKLEFLGLASSIVIENTLFCCDFFGGKIKVAELDQRSAVTA